MSITNRANQAAQSALQSQWPPRYGLMTLWCLWLQCCVHNPAASCLRNSAAMTVPASKCSCPHCGVVWGALGMRAELGEMEVPSSWSAHLPQTPVTESWERAQEQSQHMGTAHGWPHSSVSAVSLYSAWEGNLSPLFSYKWQSFTCRCSSMRFSFGSSSFEYPPTTDRNFCWAQLFTW